MVSSSDRLLTEYMIESSLNNYSEHDNNAYQRLSELYNERAHRVQEIEANGHVENSFSYTPLDVESDEIGQAILDVGGTYPERKLKPRQVPLFPEGTRQGHDPITLDVHKTQPAPMNQKNGDKFVSSE